MSIDENELLDALENETNSSIVNLTNRKIKEHKNIILQQIFSKKDDLKKYHKVLKDYRYCNDMRDIQYGFFVRWFNLKDEDNISLKKGAVILDMLIVEGGVQLLLKTFRNNLFKIKFDEVVLFQKISREEKLILSVLEYLEK
tara:strand:- start:16319 stop:16744 length:426 start_codon:yes stop_codon:yes gene_type:complete